MKTQPNPLAVFDAVRRNGYACYLAGKCDQKGFETSLDEARAAVAELVEAIKAERENVGPMSRRVNAALAAFEVSP